jgi:hypothetical protein
MVEMVQEQGPDTVAPPDYSRIGRGLVYNCTGGHWACVDQFTYFQCRENFAWAGKNDRKPDCVVKNVYASTKDCGIVQRHYVNTNESTAFCSSTADIAKPALEGTGGAPPNE